MTNFGFGNFGSVGWIFMTSFIIFSAKYLYFVIIILAALYFFSQPRQKQKDILYFSAVSLLLVYLLGAVARYLYFDPRPFVAGNFTPLIPHAPDNGFPSDHMLLSAALASILFYFNQKLGAIAWLLAFLVGTSRVYAGVHHWVDIFGSVLIAIFAVWVAYLIVKKSKIIF